MKKFPAYGKRYVWKVSVRNWREPNSHRKVKKKTISECERKSCEKAVGGERSTEDDEDNITSSREGSLLSSSF